MTQAFVETEALGLGLRAGHVERDVGARDPSAEVPGDAERREKPDEREEDGRARQPVRQREGGRRGLGEDHDPTCARRRRERDETVAAAGVVSDDGVRHSGDALLDLGAGVLIGQRVGVAAGADELMAEAVDDAEVDGRAGDDVIQLLLDIRERERAR